MRYIAQFVIPMLILIGVALILTRRRAEDRNSDGTGVVIALVAIGSIAAVGLGWAFYKMMEV